MDSANPIHENILVKKASGEEEYFSTDKLARSLANAGADTETTLAIVADIGKWISPGISTTEIYSRAFSILHTREAATSFRYRLKQAILELGPTGYPFETLIGQLFVHMGYTTQVGVVVQGKCVTHEIDVIATGDNVQHLVECKYHKDQGKHVSIQVPLYVRSRVNDIVNQRQQMAEFNGLSFKGWVITNTRLSKDSIDYGTCCDLNLLAWNYPAGNGLKERIEKFKIYPITILQNMDTTEKQYLLNAGIVTCRQLLESIGSLAGDKIHITEVLMNELREICAMG